MKRANVKTIYVTVICLIITLLCGCSLFVADKDKFILDDKHENLLVWIDLDKTGSDVVIPSKVGDKTVKEISLKDPYFSGINSLDVSHVEKLQSFNMELFTDKNRSKLKKLNFSKNKKLRFVAVGETKALEEVVFNNNCKSIHLDGTSVKKVNLQSLKKLGNFVYRDGPLEELDVSNNPYLEQIWIENANIKVLDLSKNPKLKNIIVDEGTQIIGPTNAHIKYNKKAE